MIRKQTHKLGQKGLVSILVTMFMMIVISLIVIGFAKIIRREQRQALDRQLSTQAFYAAESGVNDAIKNLSGVNTTYTGCNDFIAAKSLNATLDATAGVSYTCLLVKPNLTNLQYDTIDTEKSTVIPINASGRVTSLNLSWQAKTGASNFNGCLTASSSGNFPTFSNWPANCDAGALRIDVVPASGTLSRASLASGTLTTFLYPQNSGVNTLAYNTQGTVTGVRCVPSASSQSCNLAITGLDSLGTGDTFYLRVRSVYKLNSLTISATNGTSPLTLTGAQAQIDATGKANDVLRRISVRVDLSNISGYPDFAIQSRDSICKRFTTNTGVAPATDQGSISDSNNACALN